MAQEKSPAFQFYPKDFLTDIHVIAMTLPERGAYITLLCLCWMDCSLPVDLEALARLCRVSKGAFMRLWPALEPCFTVVEGRLVQPRIERERRKQEQYRQQQSERGKASAANRKPTGGQPEGNRTSTEGQPEGNQGSTGRQPEGNGPLVQPEGNSSSPSPSPSSYVVPTEPRDRARAAPAHRTTPIIGPNTHRTHALCDDTHAYCVPTAVHHKLASLLAPKYAGDHDAAADALLAWYPTVWAGLAAGFVMGEAFRFWQSRFDAAFASATPTAAPSMFKPATAEDIDAQREILRAKAKR